MTVVPKQSAPIIADQAEAARTWLWDSWRPMPVADTWEYITRKYPMYDVPPPEIHPVLRGEGEVR